MLSIDTFYEKIGLRLLGLFFDTPFEIHALHGDLTLLGVGCHTVSGESINSV